MIILQPLTEDDALQALVWRAQQPDGLRTPRQLTDDQQKRWYKNVVCNKQANAMWWGVHGGAFMATDAQGRDELIGDSLIGYGGVEHIDWHNLTGELSLLMSQANHEHYAEARQLIIDTAFDQSPLVAIYAEVYACSENVQSWEDMEPDAVLPYRKRLRGRWYSSAYYVWSREPACACS